MKRTVVVLLAVVGGLTLVLAAGAFLFWMLILGRGGGVSSRTILEVDLEAQYVEEVPDDPVASVILGETLRVRKLVEALERASRDARVVGLVARIGSGGHGMAVTQEFRDAVRSFREAGKFAVAFSESFGEAGPGNGGYYLASAFEEIWLQPSGDVGLTGLVLEHPFLRGTFDKLGITPRMGRRHEYKSAVNLYTETEFTEAHREAAGRLIESWWDQLARGIAEGRGLSVEEVRRLADGGPYYGQEAVDGNLVDGLAYRDEVWDRARDRAGERSTFLSLSRYLDRRGGLYRRGRTVALIYGVGTVSRGKSRWLPMSGDYIMGSETVSSAFRDAVEDDAVRAILFRIDTPGGSYVASDTILRETARAREAGKPVVVSMGNVCASGGYFAAMKADKIVAQPGTITGSIGVFAGKLVTREMWDKIGLTWDEIQTSGNATIWSSLHDYTPSEWARVEAWLDRVYEDFTGKVAESRGLPLERVREIARGRIWTGEDALEIGLVDDLGGLSRALELAKEAAGIGPDERVRLRLFPPKRTTLQMVLGKERSSSEAAAAAALQTVQELQPYGRLARHLILGPAHQGVLMMPPLEEPR